MRVTVTRQFNRRGEQQLPGSIINIPSDMLSRLQGYVEPLPETELHKAPADCPYWRQVCHAVGIYQDECTGTGDDACRIFKFLDAVRQVPEKS